MSWLCKLCETVNTDDVLECEVCNAISPHLSRFDYEEINPMLPTTIRWQAEDCNSVKLSYRGHITDVTHLNAVQILAKKDTEVTFILKNNVTEREFTYDVREHKPPITRIRFMQNEDRNFVKKLCSNKEFVKYLTLDTFGDDIDAFFDDLIKRLAKCMAFSYVIETMNSEPVGMITCQIELKGSMTTGYITYSVLSEYRNCGLASEALMTLRNETKKAGVDALYLIINSSNAASIRVAEKCGFKCDGPLSHVEDDVRQAEMLTWNYIFAEHISKRELFVSKGLRAFEKAEYDKAISLYENALKFKCSRLCPYNDGITYKYMAEACARQRKYGKAYDLYKKAILLGVEDTQINEKIKWLEHNMYSL